MGKFKLRMGRINNTHTGTCLCSKNYSKFSGVAAKQHTAFELDSSLRGHGFPRWESQCDGDIH